MTLPAGLCQKFIPSAALSFLPGCNFYPEGEVPPETKERAANGQINELTFWVI